MCERPTLSDFKRWKRRANDLHKINYKNYLVFVSCSDVYDAIEITNKYTNCWNYGLTYYNSDNSLWGINHSEEKFLELFNLDEVNKENFENINKKLDAIHSKFVKYLKQLDVQYKLHKINEDFENL